MTAYLDIVLVAVGAAVALALGAPAVGLLVGAVAWVAVRLGSLAADRRLADVVDVRRRLGLGVALGMLRVWALAGAIIVVGLTSTRADALAAALVIFGAFSVYFGASAVAHAQRKRAVS